MGNMSKAVALAAESLGCGGFVVLFDSSARESEADILLAAQFASYPKIAKMRRYGGGLVCVAIGERESDALGLPFMDKLLLSSGMLKKALVLKRAKYGDRSAFSISVNHRDAFTGVTDRDRARTMNALASAVQLAGQQHSLAKRAASSLFASEFKSPGHVQLLRSRGLKNRQGHTELSTVLASRAGVAPAVALCEMLDPKNGRAASRTLAKLLAKKLRAPFLGGREVLAALR